MADEEVIVVAVVVASAFPLLLILRLIVKVRFKKNLKMQENRKKNIKRTLI